MGRVNEVLLGTEISFSRLDRGVPEQQLDRLKFAAGRAAELRAGAAQVVRCDAGDADGRGVMPEHLPDHVFAQPSIAALTQVGIGAVRTRPCLPTRSTMHHRPSRCGTCWNVSAATSDRRSPQPRSTARMARSRKPRTVAASGALRRSCACRTESQFLMRMPTDLALFTRLMPAASSGASNPLSAASAASLRIADMRTMIDEEPK